MSSTCVDCGMLFERRNPRGRLPKRCIECKRKRACKVAKDWAANNPEKVAKRNKGPRHATCVDCFCDIRHAGKRGPLAKRCKPCSEKHEKTRNTNKRPKYSHVCKVCGYTFSTGRKTQHACSPACRIVWASRRESLKFHSPSSDPCGRPGCNNRRKNGTKYCSKECRKASQFSPPKFCQNPVCGKEINRPSQGPKKIALGADKRKYCCRECFQDHRWGIERPRKQWSEQHKVRSAVSVLRTSLRKKCKLLGVPHDEECTRLAVLERDNWICQQCGIECNRQYEIDFKTRRPSSRNAEHDHIIPLTNPKTPGNVFPNSQCLCRKCNNKKRAKSFGQLRLDLEGSVARWEKGGLVRRQQNSRSCVATLAAVP